MSAKLFAIFLMLLSQSGGAVCDESIQHPRRIMSLNVCTDELLLDVAKPANIVSVTFLSHEKTALKYWPQARKIAINHGTAEEVVLAHPDLVFVSSFTAPALRQLLVKSGAHVLGVPPAENFDQIRTVTRLVAKAVGEEQRGEDSIARMDAELRVMARERLKKSVRVMAWGSGGYVSGVGGLFDSMLEAVGARNVEQRRAGYYDLESLLLAKPDVLVYANTYGDENTLRAELDFNPVLLARYRAKRVSYDSLFDCGVPESAQIAHKLQLALRRVEQS